jgi:tRNA(adenine34) deaminase
MSHKILPPEHWMRVALEEAELAAREGEIPVGAVAVFDNQLVARDHNRSIQLNDPTAHAEIQVLRSAGISRRNYRLNEVTVYVTVEPCAMCSGALIWARADHLVYGTRDEKSGTVASRAQLLAPGLFNHTIRVTEGILAEDCRQILREFFSSRR